MATIDDAIKPLYHPSWGNWWGGNGNGNNGSNGVGTALVPGGMSSTAVYGFSGPAAIGSRRRPWPYDLIVQGTPVILRPQDNGLMIGRKMQTLANVAPITYDYSSQPVYAERTYAFRRIRGGYGERVQRSPTPTRYYWGVNVDLSVGGLQIKGPLVHEVAPPSTGPVTFFIDARDNVVQAPEEPPWVPFEPAPLSTFAGAGRYILRRIGDTPDGWTLSHDLGQYDTGEVDTAEPPQPIMADDQALKAVRFWPAGTGQTEDCLYVVTKSGALWEFDGSAWTKSPQKAYGVTVLRDELWIVTGRNTVRNCTADPLVDTNWNAEIVVGDQSQAITNLECLDNALYVFKENGVFTINPDTTANDRFPSFRQQPRPRNGVNATPWLGRMWFGYGDSYYWLDNSGVLKPTGPNILVENNSEVNGEVMAFSGHASWFGYYAMWNEATGSSYLVKHGTWVNPEEAQTAAYDFVEVPNGALKKWTGKKILSLFVSDVAPGLNSRMYCGFEDGTVAWFLLPYGTPNPAHPDSGCEATDEESWVYWPLHHAMFQADAKAYRGFSAFGPRIGSFNTVRVQYRVAQQFAEMAPDEQAPWIDLGRPFTFSGERIDLDDNVFGYAIEVRHGLESTNASTPVLEGMALHEQVRPALQLEYTFTVNARRYLARRDGVIDRRTPWQIREACLQWAASVGSVEAVMPDEGVQALSVVDYSEALAPVTKRHGVDWDISIKALQFRTLTVYGTWDRVALYDWDTISQFTWDDLLYL
jgi:hypothetical protein